MYKWNIAEIEKKKKYLLDELKRCANKEEKERLELSLISCISILNTSGSLRYTKFYNFMDRLTKDKFSLSRQSKYAEMERRLLFQNNLYLDEAYLNFLLSLANNIAGDVREIEELPNISINDEQMVEVSKRFYQSLGNSKIEELSQKILSDLSSINVSQSIRRGFEEYGGITYNDYIFNKSYITIQKTNTLFDFQALNHEVMHGIDFYMHQKVSSKNYFGFHEILTYTIDYLFLDFMSEMGAAEEQVAIMRERKVNYLEVLAQTTLMQLKRRLIASYGFENSNSPTYDMLKGVLTPQILKQLLEVESGIIAYGLKMQIDNDREEGLDNLVMIMSNDIAVDKRPDFSMVGLSDDVLLGISMGYNKLINRGKSK